MPVLNEVTHVRAAVDSLLAQDYTGPFDVVLAVAPSIDGTEALVEQLSAADPRIRVVPNGVGSTPAGLNAAIRASRHPVVVAGRRPLVLPRDYARVAVETLQRSGADNVGGVMAAEAHAVPARGRPGLRLRASASAAPPHHVGGARDRPRPSTSASSGGRLSSGRPVRRAPGRGQTEPNRMPARAGRHGLVHLGAHGHLPPLSVDARCSASSSSTGMWRGELTRLFPASRSPRYFARPCSSRCSPWGCSSVSPGRAGAVGAAPWLLPDPRSLPDAPPARRGRHRRRRPGRRPA